MIITSIVIIQINYYETSSDYYVMIDIISITMNSIYLYLYRLCHSYCYYYY